MASLFDPGAPDRFRARIDRLRADATPRWGRMNVGQMVVHCTGQLRLATGDLTAAPFRSPVSRFPLKQLAIYVLPTPKGVPTLPEIRDPATGDWDSDRDALRRYLEKVTAQDRSRPWPVHPAFGPLTVSQWGRLIAAHLDHHLRQFGV